MKKIVTVLGEPGYLFLVRCFPSRSIETGLRRAIPSRELGQTTVDERCHSDFLFSSLLGPFLRAIVLNEESWK
jgi:hypothetical protein